MMFDMSISPDISAGRFDDDDDGSVFDDYGNNEELVNFSLLSFLQVVCATHSDVDSDWNLVRVHLTFDFRKVKTDRENKKLDSNVFSLSCMVDGFPESRSTFRS